MQKNVYDESINLLIYLKNKEKEMRKKKKDAGEADRLQFHMTAYKNSILALNEKDRKASVITLQLALMTGPSNREFMDYCEKKGLFYHLSVVARCYFPKKEIVFTTDFVDAFINKTGKTFEELMPVLCQIGSMLPYKTKKELREKILDDPAKCTMQGLYYAISDHLIKMDPVISGFFLERIKEADNEKKKMASFDNPVYILLRLYKEGSINTIYRFIEDLEDESLVKMAFFPERLKPEEIDPLWLKILSQNDYRRILSRPAGEEIFDKLMSVKKQSFCSLKAAVCTVNKDMPYRRIRIKREMKLLSGT